VLIEMLKNYWKGDQSVQERYADQALIALAQIEESERSMEEIAKILSTFDSSDLTTYSGIDKIAQAIYEAQERKSKGGEK